MNDRFAWWNGLRHGGLLLDAKRLAELVPQDPEPLDAYNLDRLRRRLTQFQDNPGEHRGRFISFVLETASAVSPGRWASGIAARR
jgi:hypothetical protein